MEEMKDTCMKNDIKSSTGLYVTNGFNVLLM